jgi:hypothetical protein
LKERDKEEALLRLAKVGSTLSPAVGEAKEGGCPSPVTVTTGRERSEAIPQTHPVERQPAGLLLQAISLSTLSSGQSFSMTEPKGNPKDMAKLGQLWSQPPGSPEQV